MVSSHLCRGGKDKYCKCKENFWKRHLMNVVTIRKLNWDGGREGGWEEGGGAQRPAPHAHSRAGRARLHGTGRFLRTDSSSGSKPAGA